jgi:hypothetical protein
VSVFSVRIVCYRKEVREEIVCKKERKAGREIQRGNCGSDVQYAERRSKARLLARRAGLPATGHKVSRSCVLLFNAFPATAGKWPRRHHTALKKLTASFLKARLHDRKAV